MGMARENQKATGDKDVDSISYNINVFLINIVPLLMLAFLPTFGLLFVPSGEANEGCSKFAY